MKVHKGYGFSEYEMIVTLSLSESKDIILKTEFFNS